MEACLGPVIYHGVLCKNSSVLTHLQTSIYEAVVEFAPEKNKKILISS